MRKKKKSLIIDVKEQKRHFIPISFHVKVRKRFHYNNNHDMEEPIVKSHLFKNLHTRDAKTFFVLLYLLSSYSSQIRVLFTQRKKKNTAPIKMCNLFTKNCLSTFLVFAAFLLSLPPKKISFSRRNFYFAEQIFKFFEDFFLSFYAN